MTDNPDQPLSGSEPMPDDGDQRTEQPQGERPAPAPGMRPESPSARLGWHEPLTEEGLRPLSGERWFEPETSDAPDAVPADAPLPRQDVRPQLDAAHAQAVEPSVPQRGAWFAPPEAALGDLLGDEHETTGDADDEMEPEDLGNQTAEPPESSPESLPALSQDEAPLLTSALDWEQALAGEDDDLGALNLILDEPAPDAESTPSPESTPPQPMLAADIISPSDDRQAADSEADAEARSEPTPFEEVERKVQGLLARHHAGELSREELQQELRGLMILDDQGRWWMLGLESKRWYYYDGKDWIAGTPPGQGERVKGNAIRTETGLQEVIGASAAGLAPGAETLGDAAPPMEAEDEASVLPQRVPQDDPGATLVSPNTPFLEPVRASEARTYAAGQPVGSGDAATLAHVAASDLTLPSLAVDSDVTMPGAARQPGARPADRTIERDMVIVPPPAVERQPKYKIGEFPQPDYRAALGQSRNRNTYAKWTIRLGVFGTIGGMALTLLVLLVIIGYYFLKVNQYAEAVESLEARASDFETTLILNAGGDILAEFNNPDTGVRKEVPLAEISPWLIHATISTENETFYTDPGFSVLAIVRATYQNLREGDTVSGASTITQQLARALVLETEFASQRTNERKIVEIIVASEIRRQYTKNEILEIYLNEIFYGNFAYGIQAAAQQYFDKPAGELNPAEAAFLAGLPQAPAQYDPVVNREAAINRMRTVLRLMAEANGTGCISIEHEDQTTWSVPESGGLCVYARQDASGGSVYYYQTPNMPEPQEMTLDIALVETAAFNPPAFETTHPHFVNYVWQQLEDTYGPQAIYSAGFRVYTTLDDRIQNAAEQAVTRNIQSLQGRGIDATNASVVVMRPSDGAVLAMVGSADYYNESIAGQVNIAFTAQQAGSSIKPLVYLAALEPDNNQYWTPASVIWDVYSDFNGYVPVNYDRTYHGPKTVRESLANSLNVPAVKTLQYTGLLDFTELAEAAGITWPLGNPIERQAGLPTALGAVEVRLIDMVKAFGTIASSGRKVDAYSIVYIEDSKGNQIYQVPTNKVGPQVVEPDYAYLITDILADNAARAEEFGRGAPMELSGNRPAAIKTGTSNDSRDVWAIGYTPQTVVGVWVGNHDNRPMYGLSGYTGAAPIWNEVMEAAHADQPVQAFQRPPGVIQVEVCRDTGAQASADCVGGTYTELFAASAPPPAGAEGFLRRLRVDEYSGKIANQYCQDDVVERTFVAISDPTAIDWINNTPQGNSWAGERGLQTPLQPPPSAECDPNEPRPQVVVSFPSQDMTVEGVLPLRGLIRMPNFSRYEIRYGVSHAPGAFSEPLLVEQTERTEPDSVLGQFDTRTIQNGQYTLRVVAIDQFGRHVTRDVRINVNNPEPTPAPIPTATLAPSLTPEVETGFEAFATPSAGEVLPSPTLAPTLTATWTLTPTPDGQ